MDTMADDENPAWFREKARSAGKDVKNALDRGPNPYKQTPLHSVFSYDSFTTGAPTGDWSSLEGCKKEFENQIFRRRHGEGDLKWHGVIVMKALPYDHPSIKDVRPANGERKEAYLLAISTEGKNTEKIGRSNRVGKKFDFEEGDIYLQYEVVKGSS